MRALISDIHGNMEALTAVFEDMKKHGVDDVYFVGDLVGYGPEPEACVDLVTKKAAVGIKGNHDFALINGPYGFNYIAAEAIQCQRGTMLPKCLIMCQKKKSRWKYLDELPYDHTEGGTLYVHGSPLDPISDYVFCKKSQVMWNEEKILEILEMFGELMFCGHTHHPCIIREDLECQLPDELDYTADLSRSRKNIVNIGSVGQPRDHDTRACYVLWDQKKETVTWRRVEYDFEATAKKIEAIDCIDNRCGERLKVGK
ncbi:MAG: metallophosphoesterase family protein [Planctomycetota bacterium]|jgi:predicted phosphodiesterase